MPGTSIKDALSKWEAKTGQKATEATCIQLNMLVPPIDKMDSSLNNLGACEWLSLSTNCIEKISNLNALKNLKILSLGRNNIKNLTGLEAVADTLEQLWISYNQVEKLKGITVLKKLKNELPALEELSFVGNPLQEKHEAEGDWRQQVEGKLPRLKKLDGVTIVKQDEEED
ncbi:dynein axonemal light chain 1-like isoform X2 [Dysidea avara]|uniref:dynein axonemal light chain 1-like isoform X2 n=1 Tax=Dysidea avara TaxID=196820 RepID=UPI0033297064